MLDALASLVLSLPFYRSTLIYPSLAFSPWAHKWSSGNPEHPHCCKGTQFDISFSLSPSLSLSLSLCLSRSISLYVAVTSNALRYSSGIALFALLALFYFYFNPPFFEHFLICEKCIFCIHVWAYLRRVPWYFISLSIFHYLVSSVIILYLTAGM